MNEKLTPEQRDWVLEKAHTWLEGTDKGWKRFSQALNANTAEDVCPECGGDGIETCNNPDHSFIFGVGGKIGRLGCPVCGHDPEHKTGEICPTCDGEGKVNND